jgi:hypothetical protein
MFNSIIHKKRGKKRHIPTSIPKKAWQSLFGMRKIMFENRK